MPDETIISDYSTDTPRFRVTREGNYTIIRDYSTNAPRFKIEGAIGGVVNMTSEERLASTPDAGTLVYDTDENRLYVGDGITPGGKPVSSEVTSAYVYGVDRDAPLLAEASDSHQIELNPTYDYAGATPEQRYVRVTQQYTGREAGKNFTKMPAHNLRRCIVPREWLKDAINHVYCYLNPSTSYKKADGTNLTTAELEGDMGDFMVHSPKCYFRDDVYVADGVTRYVYLVSAEWFPGCYESPAHCSGPGGDQFADQFWGAFPSVVCTSDGKVKPQLSDNAPIALAATDVLRSIPGARPAANISRTNFRKGHARNGGLTGDPTTDADNEYNGTVTSFDDFFFRYVVRMMLIEYNTFDFKSALSVGFAYCKGYHYTSQRLTGRTLGLGNGSGEVLADDADSSGLDYDIPNSPAFATISSSEFERYPDGDDTGCYAWIFGATIRYTNTETIVANTTKSYTDKACTQGEATITAYVAAGTNWNDSAVANPALKVVAMSWRGFENIYACAWQNADGCQKNQDDTEADVFDTDTTITVNSTTYVRDGSKDAAISFAWKNGSTWVYTTKTNNPEVGATVYSNNTLSTSAGTIASKNIVEYDRYFDGDYTSGSFHSYAWKNGATVIYTKNPHPAVNEATYSDQACTTSRSKAVTAWDEDFSQSVLWLTNDSTLYFKVDSDLGVGSTESTMPASGHTGASLVCIPHPWPKAGGYPISFDPWTFFPTKLGGNSTTGLCCNFYNDAKSGPRLVLRGGYLTSIASVSPAFVGVNSSLGNAFPTYVSRLAAHPKKREPENSAA